MIIQCKQCRTKFRFDDLNMEGDGQWMRCSRCQHVFFQENLSKINSPAIAPQDLTAFSKEIQPEKTAGRLAFEPADGPRVEKTPAEDAAVFSHEEAAPEEPADDALKTASDPVDQADVDLTNIEFSTGLHELEETGETGEILDAPEEKPLPPVPKKKSRWKVALWTVLVVVVIPGIIAFVIFPKLGERYIKLGEHGTKQVLNLFGSPKPSQGQFVAGFVKLQDIRQRVVQNFVLGNIRIVEGTVLNQADFSIARIMVKSEILDAYAVVLSERVSYAGNILTDEELTNLPEAEIIKRLSLPQGRDNSNERVIPNGQIPFMIVFIQDTPGTIKTRVTVSGAERLL
ncbi:MAG: zinc-ribbon domain-containing protein [Smithellaceae bacterium]